MSVLKKDFLPLQLRQLLDDQGIDGSVAVQADQSESETKFLLELANLHEFIKAVVGWVDLQGPDLEERLHYFSQYPKLKGFRHVVQDEPDDSFLLRSSFLKGIAQLEKYGFTYDILIYPQQLQATLSFVKQFPKQKFVIDHIAKPLIGAQQFQPWADLIEQIAQFDNVWCKISGMITEADWRRWQPEDLQSYIDHVFQCFGYQRIMFGSDWPVCLLAGSYQQVVEIFEQAVDRYNEEQQKLLWGGNAAKFYNLIS